MGIKQNYTGFNSPQKTCLVKIKLTLNRINPNPLLTQPLVYNQRAPLPNSIIDASLKLYSE